MVHKIRQHESEGIVKETPDVCRPVYITMTAADVLGPNRRQTFSN